MGVDLPTDLVAWWRRANGSASGWSHQRFDLLPMFGPCRIEDALNQRKTWLEVWRDHPIERGWLTETDIARAQAKPAGTEAGMWLPGFLSIASSGGGADLFVDLRSGPMHGCVREFDKVDTDGGPRWANVTAMLTDIVHALERDGVLNGYRALLDSDGTLCWDLV